jgi:anaerobic dimethyl sulfoxide reductase subunit A
MIENERVITTTCAPHCGGGCLLKAHVKDGVITRIETDDDQYDVQLRACMRGRSWRQRIYHPNRLKHPIKRVGPRGSGRFERITWDPGFPAGIRQHYTMDGDE